MHAFPRDRDGKLNRWLRVALARWEADDIEEERDDRDESETIDSGEDAVETELAREERRARQYGCGDDDTDTGRRSRHCMLNAVLACDMAMPIAPHLPSCDAAPTAGVQNPVDCGVRRGVGN
jgi:hypothetical protein